MRLFETSDSGIVCLTDNDHEGNQVSMVNESGSEVAIDKIARKVLSLLQLGQRMGQQEFRQLYFLAAINDTLETLANK